MRKQCTHGGERGQIIPLVALALAVMMGAAALAVDVGYWRYQERLQQAAADSAAVAAAGELTFGGGGYATAAAHDATLMGYTDDGGTTTRVTVNSPPTSGGYNANASAVEVIIEKKNPSFFAKIFGFNSQWLSARAVGLVSDSARNCIYGLATTGTPILFNGSTVNAPRCGIVSNHDMTINGATVTAWGIGYANTDIDNGSTYHEAHPAHALAASDPCPSVPGCAYLKAHPPTTGACMSPTVYNGLATATLQPGRYCSNVIVNGCTNVVFNAGVYDFDAGITMNGVTNITGNGVTLYNNSGQLTINGSNISLKAPATGNTQGVVVYQNPTDTNAFIANGSGGGYAGMVYSPNSTLTINGTVSQWLLMVGANVVINGSGTNVPDAAFPGWGRAVLAE